MEELGLEAGCLGRDGDVGGELGGGRGGEVAGCCGLGGEGLGGGVVLLVGVEGGTEGGLLVGLWYGLRWWLGCWVGETARGEGGGRRGCAGEARARELATVTGAGVACDGRAAAVGWWGEGGGGGGCGC